MLGRILEQLLHKCRKMRRGYSADFPVERLNEFLQAFYLFSFLLQCRTQKIQST